VIKLRSVQSIYYPEISRILDWRADSAQQAASRGISVPESSSCPDWDVAAGPNCFYWSRDFQEPGNPGEYHLLAPGCELPSFDSCGYRGPGGNAKVSTYFTQPGGFSWLDRRASGSAGQSFQQQYQPPNCNALPPDHFTSDSAASMCGSLIHRFVINTDVSNPDAYQLTLGNYTELDATISGDFYLGCCESSSGTIVVAPPDLFAFKEGRVSTRIRIDGPPATSSGQPYHREILIRATIRSWGTATGGMQTVGWDIEPSIVVSDTGSSSDPYVTFNEPGLSPIISRDSLSSGQYCHHRIYGIAGPETTVHCDGSPVNSIDPLSMLCINIGRPTVDFPQLGLTSETWIVSINAQVSTQASYPNDIGGAGSPLVCTGLDCSLPGITPDGVIDGSDLRLLEQSRSKTSSECGFIARIDRDGDAFISNSEADQFLCAAMIDYNTDGFVDGFDYDDFVDDFTLGNCEADTNGDGFVDGFDYDFWVTMFETTLPDCDPGTTIPALGCNCR